MIQLLPPLVCYLFHWVHDFPSVSDMLQLHRRYVCLEYLDSTLKILRLIGHQVHEGKPLMSTLSITNHFNYHGCSTLFLEYSLNKLKAHRWRWSTNFLESALSITDHFNFHTCSRLFKGHRWSTTFLESVLSTTDHFNYHGCSRLFKGQRWSTTFLESALSTTDHFNYHGCSRPFKGQRWSTNFLESTLSITDHFNYTAIRNWQQDIDPDPCKPLIYLPPRAYLVNNWF